MLTPKKNASLTKSQFNCCYVKQREGKKEKTFKRNNLDGFKSGLVEELQLLLNLQFQFLSKDDVSSSCHWYQKEQH